jgi:NADP+-dependent farnesol dehydrogenase
MEKWTNSVAVVTGANSGNGLAIFKKLAEFPMVVVGLDIRIDAIEKLKEETGNSKLFSIVCDVTKDDLTEAAFKWIEEKLGGVDILINNAGIFKKIGIFEFEKPMSELALVVDLNFTAVVRCSRLAFKSMQKRDAFGYIINMNSILGHSVLPADVLHSGTYPGSKHAITATTELMRYELNHMKNTKIRVSSISPGAVKTNIFKTAGVNDTLENALMTNSLNPDDISETVCYLLSLPNSVNVNDITLRGTGSPF